MSIRKPGGAERGGNIADVSPRDLWAGGTEAPRMGIGQLAPKSEKPKPSEYPELPLKKSGERREVRWTRSWERSLNELLEQHPGHFQALHNLVEGRREEATERQVRDLRVWGYLAPDNSLLPGMEAVMKAAYRQTPDGPCLVDPLDVRTEADAETLLKAEDQLESMRQQGLQRLKRKLFGDGKGSGPGR